VELFSTLKYFVELYTCFEFAIQAKWGKGERGGGEDYDNNNNNNNNNGMVGCRFLFLLLGK
jgi:hypothetical protein